MTTSEWRPYAEAAMRGAYDRAVSQGLEGKDIIRAIDAAYPFGEREYHPYKIWLDARKKFLIAKGLIQPTDKHGEPLEFFGQEGK